MKHLFFLLFIFLALNMSAQKFNFSSGVLLSGGVKLSELNQNLVKFGAPFPNRLIGGDLEITYSFKDNYVLSFRPIFMSNLIKNDSISTHCSESMFTMNFGKTFKLIDDFKFKPTFGYAVIFINVNSKFNDKTLISNQPKVKLPTTSLYQLSSYTHSLIFSFETILYDNYSFSATYVLSLHIQEWTSNLYTFDQSFYDNLSNFFIGIKYNFK